MTVSSMPSLSASRSLPVRWPRVGALSTSFSLHGVAAAVFLLAVSAPRVELEPARKRLPSLSVTVVEPPPKPVPLPPTAAARPPAASAPRAAAPVDRTLAPTRLPPAIPALAPALATVGVPDLPAVTARTQDTADSSASVDYGTVSRPPYPGAAALRGAEGEVLVRVLVGIDGRASRIELGRSSGDRDLDRAALAAVRGWRFRPALAAGAPVAAWVVVPVAFRLDQR